MKDSRADMLKRFEREAVPLLGRVMRVALKFTRNINEAEDLVQETYLRAMERIEQFQPGSNLLAWLNRIAYTQFVNGYHKQGRRRHAQLNEALDSPTELEFVPDVEAAAEFANAYLSPRVREQMDQDMANALDRISPDLRDILVLCTIGELRYQDAAEVLEVPIGTVMSRLSRAKAAMRKELMRGAQAGSGVRA